MEESFVAAVFGTHIAPCDQPTNPEQFADELVGKIVGGWRFYRSSIFEKPTDNQFHEKWQIVRTEIIRDIPEFIGGELHKYNQVIAHCEMMS